MLKLNNKHIALIMVLTSGCIESFTPPVSNRSINFLVVDGFLNSTAGSVNIRLTRAKALSNTQGFLPEINAQVILESESGSLITLAERWAGDYFKDGMVIDSQTKYRLNIKTTQGKEYASTYVNVIKTPPIDSVTHRYGADGVSILVHAHDDQNQTRYFQWQFMETWQYNAPQESSYKYQDGKAIYRSLDEQFFTCYSTLPSTGILVHSTHRLGSSTIRDFKVNFLPAGSRKLSNKYSILVQQRGISQEAYEFWSLLEQTTENIGGLFDPQPGKVIGNLRSITDPSEPVLGIFQAGSVMEKRIFISSLDIPAHLRYRTVRSECRPDSISLAELQNFYSQTSLLVNAIYQGIAIIGYTYTTHPCADCRFEGGTLVRPDFWE